MCMKKQHGKRRKREPVSRVTRRVVDSFTPLSFTDQVRAESVCVVERVTAYDPHPRPTIYIHTCL
ncbi:hypothetical protein RJ639_046411 [Escallonia herrerae]|uniref:Uncharacterized protein n=1 Tax=Escallonia herrerae TaxID=1293975 RepID=A0AA88WFH7_9ASTE|nr:hypothetical protein RJ639_046411 [Escallonia herrerae]